MKRFRYCMLRFITGITFCEEVIHLLKLKENPEGYYELMAGASIERIEKQQNAIYIRPSSILDSILYLSEGVQVPESHLQEGLTYRDGLAPGIGTSGLEGFFWHAFQRRNQRRALPYTTGITGFTLQKMTRTAERPFWFWRNFSEWGLQRASRVRPRC